MAEILQAIKRTLGLVGPLTALDREGLLDEQREMPTSEVLAHARTTREDVLGFTRDRDRARAERERLELEFSEQRKDDGDPRPFAEAPEAEAAYKRIFVEPWTPKLREYGAANLGMLDEAIGRRLRAIYEVLAERFRQEGEPKEVTAAKERARALALVRHEAFDRWRAEQKRVAAYGRLANIEDHRTLEALQKAHQEAERAAEQALAEIVGEWGPDVA